VVAFPVGQGIFLIAKHVQTISGAQPASYSAGSRIALPERKSGRGVKQEADHLPPPSDATVKNDWRYTFSFLLMFFR